MEILVSQQQLETSSSSNKNVKKDLEIERFLKFFLIKSVQVIVQSRISGNRKIKTDCKLPSNSTTQQTNSSSEWFNMEIGDDGSILSRTHSALLNSRRNFRLEIEIYLETDSMRLLLEIWLLTVKQEDVNSTRDVYNVYNRMSLMIKSLLSVSRVTPAYKIARRISNEFRIGWEIKQNSLENNIFEHEEELRKLLGEQFKTSKLGEVLLPPQPSESKIIVELNYRTKMETSLNETNLIMKSDHYGLHGDDLLLLENNKLLNNIKKESVKPAFGNNSEENNVIEFGKIDDEFINNVPFGKLLLNKKKTKLIEEEEDCEEEETHFVIVQSSNSCDDKKVDNYSLPSLPFVINNNSVCNSEERFQTENQELLNLLEDFRIAPILNSFQQEQQEQESPLDHFEQDLILYDDFVNKLIHE